MPRDQAAIHTRATFTPEAEALENQRSYLAISSKRFAHAMLYAIGTKGLPSRTNETPDVLTLAMVATVALTE